MSNLFIGDLSTAARMNITMTDVGVSSFTADDLIIARNTNGGVDPTASIVFDSSNNLILNAQTIKFSKNTSDSILLNISVGTNMLFNTTSANELIIIDDKLSVGTLSLIHI